MKAVPTCQQVIAIKNRELPRAKISRMILAVHDAARMAGDKACGGWPPEHLM